MKDFLARLAGIQDPPDKVARGFAVGVFLGVGPSFGLATPLSILLAWVINGNRAAALLGSVTGFPLFVPAIYAAGGWIGCMVLGVRWADVAAHLHKGDYRQAMAQGGTAILLGTVILAIGCAIAAYPICKTLVIRYRPTPAGLSSDVTAPPQEHQ